MLVSDAKSAMVFSSVHMSCPQVWIEWCRRVTCVMRYSLLPQSPTAYRQ